MSEDKNQNGEIIDMSGRELTLLLDEASFGEPKAIAQFFNSLLSAEVYVPMIFEKPEQAPDIPTVGATSPQDLGMLTISYDGKECLPVFTEEEFVFEWAEREVPVQKKEFKSLLWVVDDDTWMYINANQEVGKELTAWEIARLREGPEAIDELVNAQSEDPFVEIEVRSGRELFPEFKEKLMPILEVYPDIKETFLVAVKEGEEEKERPMLGIKYGSKIEEIKRQQIKDEISQVSAECFRDTQAAPVIIDDLVEGKSPNHALFEDAKPFYYATKVPGEEEQDKKSVMGNATDKLRQLFSRGGDSD